MTESLTLRNETMKKILGVDVGGVIFDQASLPAGDINDDAFFAVPPVTDSIESLAALNQGIFKDAIYLVSKYNIETGPEGIRAWLERQNFYDRTGIPREHLYQCAERREKAPIVRELGITHFVDDRAEVMSYFADFVPNLYHFQSLLEDREKWAIKIPNLIFVDNWKDLTAMLHKKENTL